MKKVIHRRDQRLYANAGMSYPVCYAGSGLIDLRKAHLPMNGDPRKVTCKHCKRAHAKRYSLDGMLERLQG
jgi:hypothetical protein